MEMQVSIIVPIFNVAEYLEECILSICNQSFKNIEIILIDDGSYDNSSEICDKFALQDDRIKVLHKKNEGLVIARQTGLKLAKCDYIAFVDGDDWIENNAIESLFDKLIEQDVDIIMCGRFENTGKMERAVFQGFKEGRYDKQKLINEVYPNMIVNGAFFEWGLFPGVWDKLFRKKSLAKYLNEVDSRLTIGEDAACTYPALLNADSIYILQECLYHYRQTQNSMTKQNIEVELLREKFKLLFSSVNVSFEKYKDIYDLREQWIEYLLFLMVPRAESLYKNIDDICYLFPFAEVRRGDKIILYGLGTYGQLLYRYIKKTGYFEILACVDRNYLELTSEELLIVSQDEIDKFDYDAIVIASSFAKARIEIFKDLSSKYPENKIHYINEDLIKDQQTKSAFGLC
ncbi:MAG: glycosyltransferase [Lachnospirales bacterium]